MPAGGMVAMMLVLSLSSIGAAANPSSSGLCVPLIMDCGSPAPSPSPTPSTGPISPTSPVDGSPSEGGLLGGLGSVLGGVANASGGSDPLTKATRDDGAPTFTLPAAQLGGSSLSITGLKSVSLVTVPLADGTRATVIKMVADDIAINDFVLDVRKPTGPSAVTHATCMELKGHVQVYIDSLSATLANGLGLSLLADTPLPQDELPHTLLRPTLGLVGVTAQSISFTNNDLFIS